MPRELKQTEVNWKMANKLADDIASWAGYEDMSIGDFLQMIFDIYKDVRYEKHTKIILSEHQEGDIHARAYGNLNLVLAWLRANNGLQSDGGYAPPKEDDPESEQ